MSNTPPTPWIHIGECPVCVNGLCRVRHCTDSKGDSHLYAMCDECEAIFTEPDALSEEQASQREPRFPDAQDPKCPICRAPLYGSQAHWATIADIRSSSWESHTILEFPTSLSANDLASGDEEEPATDSLASSPLSKPDSDAATLASNDPAYGQDEPRPGC